MDARTLLNTRSERDFVPYCRRISPSGSLNCTKHRSLLSNRYQRTTQGEILKILKILSGTRNSRKKSRCLKRNKPESRNGSIRWVTDDRRPVSMSGLIVSATPRMSQDEPGRI